MKSFFAFLKKEWLEQMRSGKLLILLILFSFCGVMNPAIAKLTPWLMEMMSDSLADSGLQVGVVTVDALTSWTQFFKNIPLALVVFVLLESACFSQEFQRGTLIPVLTKGLARHKVVTAKVATLLVLWSAGYVLCFGITYGYNAYFWDNGIVNHLFFSAFAWWLFGVYVVSALVFFSVLSRTGTGAIPGSAAVWFLPYAGSAFPKLSSWMPTMLTDGTLLLVGQKAPGDYLYATLVCVGISVAFLAASYPLMNRKRI